MTAEGQNDAAILLNISDMIDLAIGTPEVGVVDFNMLQTVLHCLAQQLRVLGKNVELRGSVATLPLNRDNIQTIAIKEFVVDTQESDPKAKKIETKGAAPPPPPEEPPTMLVVERMKKSDSPLSVVHSPPRPLSPTHGKGASSVAAASAGGGGAGGAAGVASGQLAPLKIPSIEKLSLVTLSKFNILEGVVEDIKNRVYSSIPKNEDILQEVRSQTNLKAITDMWTSLNVSSRLEAAEEGIGKLSSLVQDLIGETTELQDAVKRRASQTAQGAVGAPSTTAAGPKGAPSTTAATPAAGTPSKTAASAPSTTAAGAPSTIAAGAPSATGAGGLGAISDAAAAATAAAAQLGYEGPPLATQEDLVAFQEMLDRVTGDLDNLTNTFYATIEDLQSGMQATAPMSLSVAEAGAGAGGGAGAGSEPSESGVTQDSRATHALPGRGRGGPRHSFTQHTAGIMERINELEKKLKQCCDNIGKADGVMKDQLNSFQDQIDYLLKQVTDLNNQLAGEGGASKLSPDLIKDLQGLMDLFATVQDMQEQLKQVHETALQLAAEKDDRQGNLNTLLEQIEILKTIKMDREDMEEAMAEKADLRALARKVSHDQFEMACDDLSRGLEHAVGKLNVQEALWQQALDDIQREIETKLDKMELGPMRDFFNNKLKQLQDNLKQMASLRREAEAAGTKRRLLRDVNCISCDARAVMPTEAASSLPVSKPLQATFSMKPYLSYELDAIRKSQASNLPQRNMHDWENIDKQMAAIHPPKAKSESDKPDKHICNRYCGGSHTTTTPAQRVARLGHFIKQWGPDVLPLSSGLAAGDDGKMYRVSPAEGANVGPGGAVDQTCTPKKPTRKSEAHKVPQKPMVISAECRCLEGDLQTKG